MVVVVVGVVVALVILNSRIAHNLLLMLKNRETQNLYKRNPSHQEKQWDKYQAKRLEEHLVSHHLLSRSNKIQVVQSQDQLEGKDLRDQFRNQELLIRVLDKSLLGPHLMQAKSQIQEVINNKIVR